MGSSGAMILASAATGGPEASRANDVFLQILPYAAIIAGLVIVGWVIMVISRRKIDTAGGGSPVGFTLADLKELRDRGELSEDEYERARQDVIGRARKAYRADGNGPAVR